MFKKILKKIGYLTLKESLEIRQSNFLLKEENESLKKVPRPVLDVNVGDPVPEDSAARRGYISQSAAFHTDIMGAKIKSMVLEVMDELSRVDNTPSMDAVLKGTINALWLIHDWGEQCVGEVLSYRDDPDEEGVEIIKDKIKEING